MKPNLIFVFTYYIAFGSFFDESFTISTFGSS